MQKNILGLLTVTFWLMLPAAAQVKTEVPPVEPNAKPVAVEHIKIHGASLEGTLDGEEVDRDALVSPQEPGLRADNIVFVGIVTGRPIVYTDTDLLLGCRFRFILEGAPAYVKEESPEPGGPLKGCAGRHAPHQFL